MDRSFHQALFFHLQVVEATSSVSVNCIEIEVQSVEFTPAAGSPISGTVEYKKQNEIAVFNFPQELPVWNFTLNQSAC